MRLSSIIHPMAWLIILSASAPLHLLMIKPMPGIVLETEREQKSTQGCSNNENAIITFGSTTSLEAKIKKMSSTRTYRAHGSSVTAEVTAGDPAANKVIRRNGYG